MQDLSHLVDQSTALTAGESNSAGNTVNRPNMPGVGAPGSKPVNPLPLDAELDSPGLELPAGNGNVHKSKFSHTVTNVPATYTKSGE